MPLPRISARHRNSTITPGTHQKLQEISTTTPRSLINNQENIFKKSHYLQEVSSVLTSPEVSPETFRGCKQLEENPETTYLHISHIYIPHRSSELKLFISEIIKPHLPLHIPNVHLTRNSSFFVGTSHISYLSLSHLELFII